MFQTRLFLLVCLVAAPAVLKAQTSSDGSLPEISGPTVTVTANRSETPYDESGSSVTVITAADLQRSGVIYVSDALRQVPGLDVVQTGGTGRATSVFIRGSESGHTLFMIDGVEMADGISTNNSFDMAHLTVDQIDRIEIVRGPQSTLYGSDAIGGVVHIITQKGSQGFRGDVSLQGGSYGTLRQQLQARGGNETVTYSVSGSHFENDGFSTASERSGNREDDGYRNTTLGARLDIDASEKAHFHLTGRHTDSRADLDNGGGAGQDDPNFRSDHKETFLQAGTRLNLWDNKWLASFDVGFTDQEREPLNPFDSDHPNDSSDSAYESSKTKFNFQNQFDLGRHQLTAGAETEEEKGNSRFSSQSSFGPFESVFAEQKARTTGFYLQDHLAFENGLAVTLGGRYDDHDRFGSATTYRGAFAYQIANTGTRLRATYGTGFKAPSLFQLFSSFGNKDLDPEESDGYDLGIEHQLSELNLRFGLTYFRNDFENLINFSNATFTYQNIAKANSKGFEAFVNYKPTNAMWLALNATFLETEDEVTGLELLRRPEEKASLTWAYAFTKKAQAQVDVRYVGTRKDNDFSSFPAQVVDSDSYTVVNLAGNIQVFNNLNLQLRIENLFDEEYEDILGYGTPELSGYLGLGLSLN